MRRGESAGSTLLEEQGVGKWKSVVLAAYRSKRLLHRCVGMELPIHLVAVHWSPVLFSIAALLSVDINYY
jgi:hypothetical protein